MCSPHRCQSVRAAGRRTRVEKGEGIFSSCHSHDNHMHVSSCVTSGTVMNELVKALNCERVNMWWWWWWGGTVVNCCFQASRHHVILIFMFIESKQQLREKQEVQLHAAVLIRSDNKPRSFLERVETEISCCIHWPLIIHNVCVCCLPAGARRPKWGFEWCFVERPEWGTFYNLLLFL